MKEVREEEEEVKYIVFTFVWWMVSGTTSLMQNRAMLQGERDRGVVVCDVIPEVVGGSTSCSYP